ncbi:unnamed protein product [Polarella glacialis]|uniref:Dienelactone hydrolase domain-containing protein n=1 Tax=Polarella glacialis TaxID=89957 RepID=A0A813K1V7_POLGL|nr:unnamed protein product [Polarella glacialis]
MLYCNTHRSRHHSIRHILGAIFLRQLLATSLPTALLGSGSYSFRFGGPSWQASPGRFQTQLAMAACEPRMAKDTAYADAVSSARSGDELLQEDGGAALAFGFAFEPLVYEDEAGLRRLHGRLVRPTSSKNGAAVLLVHTAAGPHDVFLRWRAEVLAARGFIVLIADLLGDESGRGWEPEWSQAARQPLVEDRSLLRRRTRASVAALAAVEGVNPHRIGAIGYCFGGRAVLDLARLGAGAGVAAVVSFHGILDDGVLPAADMSAATAPRVLICHGDADPFVSPESRAACESQLRSSGARWDMMVFGGVRHGFTNPAQLLNDNPAFGFDPRAAEVSWAAAETLLLDLAKRASS